MQEIPIVIREPQRLHQPIVILVDKSEAMDGPPIDAINKSLMYFKEKCNELKTEGSVTDICIIAFGGKGQNGAEPDIQILQSLAPANEMSYDTWMNPLTAEGVTPMAHALDIGMAEISRICSAYIKKGIKYNLPWLITIVKGMPTDEGHYYNSVRESLNEAVNNKRLWTQSIGLGKWYDCIWLEKFFGSDKSFALENYNDSDDYKGFFEFLVNSISNKNNSDPEPKEDTEPDKAYDQIESQIMHHPIVILVDKSEAMDGPPIDAINKSLMHFKEKCKELKTEGFVTDICIIAFGGKGQNGAEPDIQILQSFAPANEMSYNTWMNPLTAEGVTPFANAMEIGLEEISRINETYLKNNIKSTVPSLICVLKGAPTDERYYYNSVKMSVKEDIENKRLDALCMCLGVTSPMTECIDIFGINSNGVPRVGLIKDDDVASKYNVVFNFIIDEICGPIKPQINGKSEYLISESKTLNEDVNTKINQYTKGNSETAITIKDPEKIHMPIILLVDKSEAMSGSPIDALNQSLMYFKELYSDLNTNDRVADICIIAFGGKGPNGDDPDIQILQPFAPANEMSYDTINNPLIANGTAPLANAVKAGLYEIARIKMAYAEKNVIFNKPWLFCLVKGMSTENKAFYNSVKNSLTDVVYNKGLFPFCMKLCDESEDYDEAWVPDLFGEDREFKIPLDNNVFRINCIINEFFEKIKEDFNETDLQERISANIDLIYCIDATRKMKEYIAGVKSITKTLHYDFVKALEARGSNVKLRLKLIIFHGNSNSINETHLFNLPADNQKYEMFMDKIKPDVGSLFRPTVNSSELALKALHYAIKYNWFQTIAKNNSKKQIILLFTSSSSHTTPETLTELFDEWSDKMNELTKRLIIIAPDGEPWNKFEQLLDKCWVFDIAAEGLNEISRPYIVRRCCED